jgi:hypothetical protein
MSDFYPPLQSGDLLLCAKHLFVAARTVWHRRQSSRGERNRVGCSSQFSLTGHRNRGINGVIEIVPVVGRGLVSIAKVHAIIARAHHAQSEPEMARDRFGFCITTLPRADRAEPHAATLLDRSSSIGNQLRNGTICRNGGGVRGYHGRVRPQRQRTRAAAYSR